MIETNYQDSGDSSDKPSNTSTKTLQDLQNNISKHFQIKKKQFPTYLHLTNPKIFLLKRKSHVQSTKNRGKSLFLGKRIDFQPAPLLPGFPMLQGAPVAEVFRLAWPVSKTTRMSSVSRGYSSMAPGHVEDGIIQWMVVSVVIGPSPPMKISPFKHRAIWKGNNQPQVLGDLRSSWLLTTYYLGCKSSGCKWLVTMVIVSPLSRR